MMFQTRRKPANSSKVSDLNAHGEKVRKGDCGSLVCDEYCSQSKRERHDRQVIQLGSFDEELTAKSCHWKEYPEF